VLNNVSLVLCYNRLYVIANQHQNNTKLISKEISLVFCLDVFLGGGLVFMLVVVRLVCQYNS